MDVHPFPCASCLKKQDAPYWDWKGKAAKILRRFTLFVDFISFLLDCILVVTLAGKGWPGLAVLVLAAILLALSGACFIKSALGKKRFWMGLLLSELYIYLIQDTTTILLFSNVDDVYDPSFVANVINVFVKCAGAAMIAVPLFCISSIYLTVALVQGSRDDVTSGVILALGSLPVVACFSFFIYMLTGVVYSQNNRGVVQEKAMVTLYALSVIVALSILIGTTAYKINTRASGSQMGKTRSLSKISKLESFRDEQMPTYEEDHNATAQNDVDLNPSAMDRNSNISSSVESMPSIDYDYSGAFRDQGSGTVVSSVGGTAGSTTHSQDVSCGRSLDNNSHNSQSIDSKSHNSRYFDNISHNSRSTDNNSGKTPNTQNSANIAMRPILLAHGFKIKVPSQDDSPRTKEIFLDVHAPPGKLGIIIDRDDYSIFVHSIKEHSSVIGKLFASDRLVAIDDECIRMKTVKEVSRMVAERSANQTRKFRVIRSVPETQEEV